MRATFKLQKPDQLLAVVTISETVEAWREISEQIQKINDDGTVPWPICKLFKSIDELLTQVDKTFYSDIQIEQ